MNYIRVILFVLWIEILVSVNGLTCYECSNLQKEIIGDSEYKHHSCDGTLNASHMKHCSPYNDACGTIFGTTAEGYNVVIRTCFRLMENEAKGVKDYHEMLQLYEVNYSVNGQLHYCNSTGCNNGTVTESFRNNYNISASMKNDSTTETIVLAYLNNGLETENNLTTIMNTNLTTEMNSSRTEKPDQTTDKAELTTKMPIEKSATNDIRIPNNGLTNHKFNFAILLIIPTFFTKYFL